MRGTSEEWRTALMEYEMGSAYNNYNTYLRDSFDKLWAPLQKQYNTQVRDLGLNYDLAGQQLQQETNKNIYQAYNNYIASQMQMGYTKDLTSGYRDTMNRNISDAYTKNMTDSALALDLGLKELETKEAADLASLEVQRQSEYDKGLSTFSTNKLEELTDDAERLVKIQYKLNDYIKSLDESYDFLFDVDDEGNRIGFTDVVKQRFYKTENGNEVLTEEGLDFYSTVLGTGFSDYIEQNFTADELDSWLSKDQANLNKALFGKPLNPYDGSKTIFDTLDNVREAEISKRMDVEVKSRTIDTTALNHYNDIAIDRGERSLFGGTAKILKDNGKIKQENLEEWAWDVTGELTNDADMETYKEISSLILDVEKNKSLWQPGELRLLDDKLWVYYDGEGFSYEPNTAEVRRQMANIDRKKHK